MAKRLRYGKIYRWLPTPSSYKVISPPPLPLDVSWVGDLIDHDLGVWKFDLLKRLFMPYEAGLIASIALSLHLSDDKLVWAPTSNGKFSVWSAYQVAMEMAAKEDKDQCLMDVNWGNSRSGFGGLIFHTKLGNLLGEHAKIFSPLRRTFWLGKCCRMGGAKHASWRWSPRHTCFGTVLRSMRCGQSRSFFQLSRGFILAPSWIWCGTAQWRRNGIRIDLKKSSW